MSIRTTVTLDEDVLERVKQHGRASGLSFREALNELLRTALVYTEHQPRRIGFRVTPTHMGYHEGLNYDDIESLLEYGEGETHR